MCLKFCQSYDITPIIPFIVLGIMQMCMQCFAEVHASI